MIRASISKIKIGTEVRDIHAIQLTNERKITLDGAVTGTGYFDGSGDLTITTSTNHTHNYAGSSSAGGGAKKNESYQVGSITTTYGNQWHVINQWITNDRLKIQILNDGAVQSSYPIEVNHAYKLVDPSTAYNKTTALLSKGSATQPVYFSEGVPVACTYSINATVPANAKFTDTVYTHPTTSGNKHIPSGGSSGQILRWSADGTAVWGNDNNSAHGHSAGVGLTGSGSAGTSGTYTYKVNLVNETAASNAASYTAGGTSKFYAVQLDKNNKLGVYVPWTDNNTVYSHPAGSGASKTSGFYKFSTDSTSHISGVTAVTKADITALGIPAQDTTYGSMSINEGTTGTATTNRVLTAANLKGIINAHAPTKTGGGASGTWGISITGNAGSVAWSNVTGKPSSFPPESHTHNYAGSSSAGGAANSANKLTTARTIQTNLASTAAASFDGSANITPGVTGVLGVANGGTGVSGHTVNRLVWSTSATQIQAAYHYANNTKVAINSTSEPSTNFYVNGTSAFKGDITIQTDDTDRFINFANGDGFGWRIGYLGTGTGDANYLAVQSDGPSAGTYSNALRFGLTSLDAAFGGNVYPLTNNTKTLGTSSLRWNNVYATTFTGNLSGNASSASKVNNSLTIKLNSGTTEGTNLFTFNGSAAKSINITAAAIGASASGHKHTVTYKKASTATGNATATGTISAPKFTGVAHKHTFTGSSHNHTLTPTTATIKQVNSTGTMFKAEVSGEVLILTPGSAPTTANVTVYTGLTIAKATQGGTIANTTATGTVSAPTFTGTAHSHTITLTDTTVTSST